MTSVGALDAATAMARHLLVVPDDSGVEDVEALALSRFRTAALTRDGVDLAPGCRLTGPWWTPRVPELGLPPWSHHLYVVHAPRQRGQAVPRELRGRSDLLDAFADGEPVGTEREVVDFVLAVARRLGGALRVEGRFGLVLTPPMRPDLILYSDRWIDPARLVELLADHVPGLHAPDLDAPDLDGPDLHGPDLHGPGLHRPGDRAPSPPPRVPLHAPPGLDEGERRWLHAEADAFDAAARPATRTAGYGALAYAPDGSVLSIAVEPVDRVPLVVSAQPWAADGAVCYEIRHHRPEPDPTATRPRGIDLSERAAATDPVAAIDAAARALLRAVGGQVVDDDGFLVALA